MVTEEVTVPATTNDLAEFEETYRAHVAMVQSGDLAGVMGDMLPASLPSVFEGVTVPRGPVLTAEVRAARLVGDRGVGEAVYATQTETIGLRSGWVNDGGHWKADTLENFEA